LNQLWLDRNPLSNIEIIRQFHELHILGLSQLPIQSLDALVANPGLGEGDEIDLREADLSINPSQKTLEHVQELRDRGTIVHWGE
ncbi:hypothetical protein KAH43_03510, partial [Candidatus Bipolaricaulota bacterium]|nr:hypothetical protein [Candidatus Bipolaricaulota bacterium]